MIKYIVILDKNKEYDRNILDINIILLGIIMDSGIDYFEISES